MQKQKQKQHVAHALCGPPKTWPLPLDLMIIILEFSHHARFGKHLSCYLLFFPFKNKRM